MIPARTLARLRIASLAAGLVLAAAPGAGAQGVIQGAAARGEGAQDAGAQGMVQIAAHQYQLDLKAGWSPAWPGAVPGASTDTSAPGTDMTTAQAVLARYRHEPGGARLVITRVDYPNPGAWARKDEFFDEVEQGIRAAAPGCTQLQERRHRLGRVPAMDVRFRRRVGKGSEVVLMRFLFFRRYTLTLTLAAPARAYRRQGRAYRTLVDGFVPYFAS